MFLSFSFYVWIIIVKRHERVAEWCYIIVIIIIIIIIIITIIIIIIIIINNFALNLVLKQKLRATRKSIVALMQTGRGLGSL